MMEETENLKVGLYVVATPIGNLKDISLRALEILKAVAVIAAEDTRNTRHLLQHYGIHHSNLLALHQHNERAGAEKIINLLQAGKSVALVSDAGTPAVSDPGALLVAAVREAGLSVISIPGASAVITALSASGLAGIGFTFHGFLANKSAARRKELQALAAEPRTLVFYEAPHRVEASVQDMCDILGGEREIVIARELTKLFEQIHHCRLAEAQAWLQSDTNHLRGEFVILISGAVANAEEIDKDSEHILTILLADLPVKQAVQLAHKITGIARNALYEKALLLKSNDLKQN